MNIDIDKFFDEERIKYDQNGLIACMSYRNCKRFSVSGTSMTTVQTDKCNHYRIGGQDVPILTTLFLILVDEGYLRLDEKIGKFLPKVPNGKFITLQMLCNMTAGLLDTLDNPVVSRFLITMSFKQWTSNQLLNIVYDSKPLYPPGERFYFAVHTNMLLLGTAMKIRMNTSVKCLIDKYITNPLKLKNTQLKIDQNIQNSVLHSFSNSRISYYEDSTYWNGSWGSYATKINSNSSDINIIGKNIGSGSLISEKLYNIQMSNPEMKIQEKEMFGIENAYYGMGVAVGGFGLDYLKNEKYPYSIIWTNQNFGGYIGIWAYIPRMKITINVQSNTFNSDNFSMTTILTDLFDTYTFSELKRIICDH